MKNQFFEIKNTKKMQITPTRKRYDLRKDNQILFEQYLTLFNKTISFCIQRDIFIYIICDNFHTSNIWV